ncbi:hypothetical protein ABPG74_002805 [Tetrahymena malaccensis]
MKILSVCIIGLLILCSVNAITDEEIASKDACVKKIPNPCQDSDSVCKTEQTRVDNCFKAVGTYPTFKELAQNIKASCKSDNTSIQKEIDAVLSCLSSSMIVSSIFIAILAFIL